MPPKPVTTKQVRDAVVARRVTDLAQTKRVIADFGTFPTSYFNKRQKQYTLHDAFGGATPSTPYIPTNVNPPFTTDTTKALFNRSIPVDSVLNSASENEDDDSLDSGSRKVAAIETTHNIHPTFVFEKLCNRSDQVKYDKLKDEHISLQEIHNKLKDEQTSLQEIYNDLVRSYYKISSDLNHYKGQHSVQVSSLRGYEDSSALAANSARRLFLAKMDPSFVAKVVSYIFKTKKFCCEQVSDVLLYIRLTMDVLLQKGCHLNLFLHFPKRL